MQINQALLVIHTSDNQATAINVNDDICDRFRVIVESKRQFLDLKLTKQNITHNKTDDLANYDLLGKFATAANKHWSNHPAFMFYQVYAEINGKIFNLEPYQFQIIDEAMNLANTQKDQRTAIMIINFMRN